MEDRLHKIFDEKALVDEIKEKGMAGWSSQVIPGGTIYRFILNDGTYKEAVNISRTNRMRLQIDEWAKW